jgi:hypothetical protein
MSELLFVMSIGGSFALITICCSIRRAFLCFSVLHLMFHFHACLCFFPAEVIQSTDVPSQLPCDKIIALIFYIVPSESHW